MPIKFKIGDIVQLKSGGPAMTVQEVETYDDNIECVWFAGAKRSRGVFDPETLIRLESETKK